MLSILLALATASVPTDAPAPLMASGAWVVNGQEDYCMLQRDFTGPKGKVTLALKPLVGLGLIEVYIQFDERTAKQSTGVGTITLSSGARIYEGEYLSVATSPSVRSTRLTTTAELLDSLRDDDRLMIIAKPVNLTFAVGKSGKARAVLSDCVTSLKKSWGMDPATQPKVAVRPVGNPGKFFGADNYPPEALSRGIHGRVTALLLIGPTGAVEKCRIIQSAGEALNKGTCSAAAKVRFEPALDVNGKPVATTYVLPVRWMLP